MRAAPEATLGTMGLTEIQNLDARHVLEHAGEDPSAPWREHFGPLVPEYRLSGDVGDVALNASVSEIVWPRPRTRYSQGTSSSPMFSGEVEQALRARVAKPAPRKQVFSFADEVEKALQSHKIGRTLDVLPFDDYAKEFRTLVEENQVVFLHGKPGTAKSTRGPQSLVGSKVVKAINQTQPRRIAAEGVHDRILDELGIKYGEELAQSMVSLRTGGMRKGPDSAVINIVTDGVEFSRQLKELEIDGRLNGRAIFLDEIHEGNANLTYLAATLRDLLSRNPGMRVILSSATPDMDGWMKYFADATGVEPAVLYIPGQVHKVSCQEKPESNIVREAIESATMLLDGASSQDPTHNGTLVFVPGKREIAEFISSVGQRMSPAMAKMITVLGLHARMAPNEQAQCLQRYPGGKIVVATRVAETSITIPDIYKIIDAGLSKYLRRDADGAYGLTLDHISRAEALQRAGRTGRTCRGEVVRTALGPDVPLLPWDERREFQDPDIFSSDPTTYALKYAAIGVRLSGLTLRYSIDQETLAKSVETLKKLGALDNESGKITDLGERMIPFPVRETSMRAIIEAQKYPETVQQYVAAIAGIIEAQGLPQYSKESDRAWMQLTEETRSDPIAQLDMFVAIQDFDFTQMAQYDLDVNAVLRARETYGKIINRQNVEPKPLVKPTEEERILIIKCLLAGNSHNIYRSLPDGSGYGHMGSSEVVRYVSKRSVTHGHTSRYVIGSPYRVEYMDSKKQVVKINTIESVTDVDPGLILEVLGDTSGVEWRSTKFVPRQGGTVWNSLDEAHFNGHSLGVIEERAALPSLQLRERIIKNATEEHPGANLQALRAIKKRLEALARIAKDPVPQLTGDYITKIVQEAATHDIDDAGLLDRRIGEKAAEKGICMEMFVSPEREARIIADAPPSKEFAGGVILNLKYAQGKPYVPSVSHDDIVALGFEEPQLDDGRPIRFLYYNPHTQRTRKVSLLDLRYLKSVE